MPAISLNVNLVTMKRIANQGSVKRVDNSRRNDERSSSGRIFLLSPANIAGVRANLILSEHANFELARRLRNAGAPLGEVFSFISGLYFRGKLAYAQKFAELPTHPIKEPALPQGSECLPLSSSFVITARGGLVPPDALITLERLREISAVGLDPGDTRYRAPLVRDARVLAVRAGPDCQIVLLGSIATEKYLRPLQEIFGEQLFFPAEFVGRGDLSRGGLMLRCVAAGEQLTYVPVADAPRHGPRPAKLSRLPRR